MRAIMLDATYEPLGIVSWKKAWRKTLELKDRYGNVLHEAKATVLWSYPDKVIRSERNSWDFPAIIILKKPSGRKRNARRINPSKRSILVRDLYTCQYCGKKLSNTSGTRDHVYPESLGGPATWENLVACCKACQQKKADRTCEQSNMYPMSTPREPTLVERFRNGVRIANATERRTWMLGLKKLGLDYLMNKDGEETE